MANLQNFNTCSTTKTYSTYDNAVKAFESKYADLDISYIVIKLDEHNNSNPKHIGRYIPVALGMKAIEEGVHFNFHVRG